MSAATALSTWAGCGYARTRRCGDLDTKFLPNLPTPWRDVPVENVLGDRLGCPVRALHDVHTASLGELRFGHGGDRPRETLAIFSVGTGVGGRVAIDSSSCFCGQTGFRIWYQQLQQGTYPLITEDALKTHHMVEVSRWQLSFILDRINVSSIHQP